MKAIGNFFKAILNFFRKIFLEKWLLRKIGKIIKDVEGDLMDFFLETLLKVIRIFICIDKKFAKNIQGFNAKYVFKSEDNKIAASAIFANNKMKVKKKAITDPDVNITVVFKDSKALFEFLMAEDPDVFAFILESKISYEGNVNYLMKFAYMAMHLKLKFSL